MFETEQANCLGVDPELFFPVGSMNKETERSLRRICMSCEVWDNCYEYSLNYKVDGYWAGTLPDMRDKLRKELGIEPIKLDTQYKETLMAQTPEAKKARQKRESMREARNN
jgi:hypothetical protein